MNNVSVDSIREKTWKKKATVLGISLAATILFIRFITDFFLMNSNDVSNYTILLYLIALISLLTYIKRSKEYDNAIYFTALFSFLPIYTRASFTGGIDSPVIAWFTILPVVSSFLLSKKRTYTICMISLIFIIITAQFPLLNYINMPAEQLSPISKVLIYISVIVTSTIFCIGHGRKREEMMNKIEDQKMSILSSSRNIELSELASGIAHEINNPLTVLKVKAKKIKKESNENIEIQNSIDKILTMSERISKVVKSMKNLSRAQQNENEIPSESLDYIFENIMTLCETKLNYSNIEFKVKNEVKDIDNYKIPVQLGHILLNLINNAYDAVLTVGRKWIVINIEEETGLLIFKISDSGEGIPREKETKIFDPYFTDKTNRTGLGLSISKNNLVNLGGELTLDTREKHTTFVVTIPVVTDDKNNTIRI